MLLKNQFSFCKLHNNFKYYVIYLTCLFIADYLSSIITMELTVYLFRENEIIVQIFHFFFLFSYFFCMIVNEKKSDTQSILVNCRG
ncbi:hypothetical protein GLOIN_2v1633359 [Rhizophagus irregularis DAOM 181602=DAOM 197198]|uniref:Uncharacterized protein n=1 Tax=Rhizophagus irregularis (strain DAOM 181602 / DAOM 197198 / MUCL 43194) TaxID=747089 RepID=A0A2P4PTL8_RHIID|nr:hypothetical protein GLOIN_2v1633359 [Rhizophagus irregularis DAOM 181602=DAOM 197198]POG68726.1 hypothetical protein GLOIN_2v1633359 [Rhizophagus irregularis DAOM 181602=DAOM 197198]GET51789.1 hypothetical protein GLOIN_2v1633359 [Rhizophagus irregularis DAOM 181602=DAOM 197198]|eukprot:XP_025175592.1 hypothetical protein GLOIN_2v1633359 [Rhizophagus irregularis DAOM 181602=DAOM 197198]